LGQGIRPTCNREVKRLVTRAVLASANTDVREKPTESGDHAVSLKQLPRHLVAENLADDPTLGNPLERLKRMGTDWIGVVIDYEGGLVEATIGLHTEAWLKLAEEEVKPRPFTHVLKRAAHMKAEQAISEVLCWGREPVYVRRLAQRKEEIYEELLGDWRPAEVAGTRDLLNTLKSHEVPVAVCSLRNSVHDDLKRLGLESSINAVVAAEDVQRCQPDPEAYMYAAQLLKRPVARCAVIGTSIQSFEAAHECGMQSIAIAGQRPLYELRAADLVVKQLDELSFVNFKQLFTLENGIEPQVELEEEVDAAPQVS